MTNDRPFEKRSAKRFATSGKLWYLGERDINFSEGWAKDASNSGLSFVTSVVDSARVGEKISISRDDPTTAFADCEVLRVCRVEPHGDSLYRIACSRFL